MQTKFFSHCKRLVLGLSLLFAFPMLASAQHQSRGLWVGEIVLNKVNEVTVPINAANVPIAPNPTNATPTKDVANLRLILHVDGSGQTRLLKSVAVIDLTATNSTPNSTSVTNIPGGDPLSTALAESNIVLITDETLYPNYPGVATRFASVAFDFSDLNAVNAVKAGEPKVNAAAVAAASAANNAASGDSLTTVSNAVRTAAFASAASTSAPGADLVAMTNVLNSLIVATVEEFSRARARNATLTAADKAKISTVAQETGALALNGQSMAVGAVPINHVALTGTFAAGGTLAGTCFLGEDHPTNPFRHKFHPDHQFGFPITRNISLIVSSPSGGGSFERAGYGVDRLTGIYKEEIFGLHKPLGTAQNIGLRTEGVFTLNRLTLKSTLNQ